MKIIGITGGAGSGKSYVCDMIRKHFPYPVVDSDCTAKELMEPGMAAYEAVVGEFGPEILCEDATIDRNALAEIVFHDKERLERLNALTHPVTIAEIRKRLHEYEKQGCAIACVESALAQKAGYRDFCDELWLVYASDTERAERLYKKRGYSPEKIADVMRSQASTAEMLATCDRVLMNDIAGNEDDIYRQLRFFFRLYDPTLI